MLSFIIPMQTFADVNLYVQFVAQFTLVVIPVMYYALYWRRNKALAEAPSSLGNAH